MRIYRVAVLVASCIPSTVAFVANIQKSAKTHLNLHDDDKNNESWDNMMGPAIAGLAGLTLASQMAVAATLDPSSVASTSEIDSMPIVLRQDSTQRLSAMKAETAPVSAISGSSIELAVDYLDFSLPSYGDTVSSTAKPKADVDIPAFNNPFGDAEDKEAEKAAKVQAAAEKKAADEAAAAQKKAEKAARREAEKEKQRLAVQRANEAKEEKAAADVAAPAAEESPSIKLPEFTAPDIAVPEFKAPDIKVPEFKAPDFGGFKAPDVPEFKAPDGKIPEFKAPDFGGFKAPDTSEFKAPDVKLPEVSLPKFSAPKLPDMPKIDAPSFSVPSTSFEAPKVPSFSTPSFSSSGSSSGGYESFDENAVDDQEERDAIARDARTAFNEADASAKEVENKAKQLRAIANDKKKVAKEAKDAACETRFGGKFLCIRPFGIGY